MRGLHEHMVTRQPGLVVWLLLLGLFLGGVAATLAVPFVPGARGAATSDSAPREVSDPVS
jgi:hypothetical protein